MRFRARAPAALAFACLVVLGAPAHAAKAIHYTVTDLGSGGFGDAINAKGIVAGSLGEHAAVFGKDGASVDLGTLGGPSSQASSLNRYQTAVGESETAVRGVRHAFRYAKNQMVDLGTLSTNPSGNSYASEINDAGQVVGSSDMDAPGGTQHAFLYQHGSMTDLGVLPGYTNSAAAAINAAGHIAGSSYNILGAGHATLVRDGVTIDLGAATPDGISAAYGMNDLDQVVGESTLTSSYFTPHLAFLYTGGVMKSLGVARPTDETSIAIAVNNHGVVVGMSASPSGASYVAFVYDGKTMKDLNTLIPADSGWVLTGAWDINDKGEIVGAGYLHGVYQGYRATPVVAN